MGGGLAQRGSLRGMGNKLSKNPKYLTVSSFPLVLTSQVTMTAPNFANFRAINLPMPEPPPVISTISPSTLFVNPAG